MDRLGLPCLAIAGNHDVPLFDLWARLTRPYARYARAFGTVLEPEFERPDLLVMGVKTTRRWRHQHGEISPAQIERVADRLAQARPEQLRVVVVHQPMAVPDAAEGRHLLKRHEPALAAWAAAGADLVLGGHIHLPYTLQPPRLPRPLWVVQAGTAVSRRTRPGVPHSVNLVRWSPGPGAGGHIERWDYAVHLGQFQLAGQTGIQPHRAGVGASA